MEEEQSKVATEQSRERASAVLWGRVALDAREVVFFGLVMTMLLLEGQMMYPGWFSWKVWRARSKVR